MKRIAVVATEKEYADFLMNHVAKYMNRYAQFVSYSIAEIEKAGLIEEDFVLLSAFNIFQQVRQKISEASEIIVLSLSLSKRQMEPLKEIPSGTKALLVNFDNRSCMHTITCMYDAGIRDLELVPYYGEGDYDHDIDVAITPNEAHLVPAGITKVYNVGESSVDMNSLYNIADKLGVYEEFAAREANEARKEYYYINSSMDKLMGDKASMTDKLNTLIKLMNEGIIITDSTGRIYLSNEKAQKLLAERSKVLQGFHIEEVLPELDVNSTKERLAKTPGANLIVSAVEIRSGDEMAGHIITVTDFEEAEEKQHGMRAKLNEASHAARYHFEDILGESDAIRRAIADARQIAASEAAVMIIGESGTGKEMFAQSIHNASARRKYNFVAVNCAAIPENLLESEMFGYEEGSFTGAKKGGKMGFFELAHRGTIFLDEIGEMPLQLQSKLLRVLEERKVMRVGGSRNIDVDVRIISATNKNLFQLVERGEFREDLYYRLNVLPLSIPPLRERREDVLPIFYSLAERMNSNMQLSPESGDILIHYAWRGNVRELRNVVEFLGSKGKKYIEAEDLPPLKYGQKENRGGNAGGEASTIIDKFILNEGREIELYYAVLRQLRQSLEQSERYGRQKLLDKVNSSGGVYTEGEVRKALTKLSSYGFIRSPKGRGGSVINHEGIRLLEVIETFRERGILR
ncbi:sigma-54 interaction domain-containing protein [Emergencia sp.]|uniref:sigma-54 interaction domain-containing protein n=1 Tax=Emergencia sp. TaxID=1926557 RepID=UPI003AEF2BC0